MKKIKRIYKGVFIFSAVILLISCSDNNPTSNKNGEHKSQDSFGPPKLTRVSLPDNIDSTVTEGHQGERYIIIGENLVNTKEVTFNGVEANINPSYITNTNIYVKVPDNTPYENGDDKIVVTTDKGSANIEFSIIQPAPDISDFTPGEGMAGDTLTINGAVFDNTSAIWFGDKASGKKGQIVNSTPNKIMVVVPEGVTNNKITVITPGGKATSNNSFSVKGSGEDGGGGEDKAKYVIYDDELQPANWSPFGFETTTVNASNEDPVKSGSHSIKVNVSKKYSGFSLGADDSSLNLTDKDVSSIRFSVYREKNAGIVTLTVNNDYSTHQDFEISEKGKWVTFEVALTKLGAPTQLQAIVFYDASAPVPGIFYIDDIELF